MNGEHSPRRAGVAPADRSGMMATMFLGDDLLAFLALALGGALFVGNVTAIIRPPDQVKDDGNLERAPVGRSLLYAGLGLVVAVWALATLITG